MERIRKNQKESKKIGEIRKIGKGDRLKSVPRHLLRLRHP